MDAIAASAGSGKTIGALQYDYGSGQVLAVGATAVSSAAFANPYTVVALTSSTNCWFSVGGTAAIHTAGSDYLAAGQKWWLKIPAGATISVIQDTLAGYLSITPASSPSTLTFLLDTVPAAVAAYSLRRLTNTYSGPCINVRRASDSTTLNIGFLASGDLDVATLNTFISATTGSVATWYDQSGNGNNAVQATAANQPPVTASLAAFNGRPALFGGASANALVLSAPAAASLNNPFASASGGVFSSVINKTGVTGSADTLFYKNSLRLFTQTGTWQFIQGATTNGLWSAARGLPLGAHVAIMSYSSASLSNVPTFQLDSTISGLSSVTQPTGTITSDAANPLNLGNLPVGNNNGFPGHIGEMILWNTAVPLAPVYANQKAYWGTP